MPDFKTPEAQQFWEYWRSLQGERLVPLKSQFRPEQIHQLLPDLFMLKLESRDLFRMTLVGTRHTRRGEEEMTGSNILDRIPNGRNGTLANAIWQAAHHPVCNHIIFEEMTASGRRTMLEMVHLPLTEDGALPRYIAGIAPEMDNHDYNLAPVKSHTHMSQIIMQNYIDIGAGLPASGTPDMSGLTAARP